MLLHLRPPPPGATRLDDSPPEDPVDFVRRLAAAVDELEGAGGTAPSIAAARVWVDEHGDVFLDPESTPIYGESPAAELARMLEELAPRAARRHAATLTRAREGAYLSAGQFAADLDRPDRPPKRRRPWDRRP